MTPTDSAQEGKVGWVMSVTPSAKPTECERVTSFNLRNESSPQSDPPENVVLVEGTPSAVSIGKYQEGETTQALSSQIVPVEMANNGNEIQIRPRGLLAIGQTYTILSNLGVLGVATTTTKSERGYLSRLWPRDDSAYGVTQVIYCGATVPPETADVELFPSGAPAHIERGLDSSGDLSENCIRVVPDVQDVEVALPPMTVQDVAIEPSPFRVGSELGPTDKASCRVGEVPFGPGCALIDGDRAIVRGPQSVTFWAVSSALGRSFQVVEPGARYVIPELGRLDGGKISAVVFDLAGRSIRDSINPPKPIPRARVIINEIMANPLGAEPAEEWVELLNAGTVPASLLGYKLADGTSDVELPSFELLPGQFVLLTRNDFVGGQSGDIPPEQSSDILRLPQLSKAGLSNSGEALTLLDAEGTPISTFPARASARAGISLARRMPSSLDDDPLAFAFHGGEGASPGSRNEVD